MIAIAVTFLLFFLFASLAIVFNEAFAKGLATFYEVFHEPDAIAAIKLTLLVAGICVPANVLFGLAAAGLRCLDAEDAHRTTIAALKLLPPRRNTRFQVA